jgi:hypothetical protein
MAAPSLSFFKKDALCYAVLFGVAGFFAGRISLAPVVLQSSSLATRHTSTDAYAESNPPASENAPHPLTTASTKGWSEQDWQRTKAQPASPENAAALAAMLEKLASTNPQQSMGLAQAEPNLVLREIFVQAVLRGWAKSSPIAAARWAVALPISSAREAGLMSVFASAAATDSEQAVRTGKTLAEEYPGEAVSWGGHLVDALCQAGDFQTAVKFAADGNEGTRPFWLGEAYSKWATFQPQVAAQAAASLADPVLRAEALRGVIGGWSTADPASLVQYVSQLPATADKGSMVSQALQRWAKLDPIAASDWINNQSGGTELDQGVASVATTEALKPDIAASWAESIVNPKLRSETLVAVLRNWSTTNLDATRSYFEKSHDLLPEDRTEIAGMIATLSGQPVQ